MEFNVQVRNSQFEKSLINKIARVSNSLEREVEKELKVSLTLTFSQFRLLYALKREGDVSQRQLAAALDVTPAVVTRQAEVLSTRGLLTQRQNPNSKRENLLALTEKGDGAVVDAMETIAECERKLLSRLSLRDETALSRAVDVLIQ